VLAACLQNATEMSAALRAYEQRRIKRANAIIKRSWELGRVAQWENPVACTVRNAMLKRVPSSLLLKQLEGVLGYEV
jgi:2-polyprenyl-6-methoxyphenol hydroxylase-like FAD-dependent oxidoreductase